MPSTFEAIEKNIEQYVDMSSGKYRIDNLVMAWEIFKLKTPPQKMLITVNMVFLQVLAGHINFFYFIRLP